MLFGSTLLIFFLVYYIYGFSWVAIMILTYLSYFFIVHHYKNVTVSVNNTEIFIENNKGSTSVPIENIKGQIKETMTFRLAYKIKFVSPTKFGKSVFFYPRTKLMFLEHTECKKFLKLINT